MSNLYEWQYPIDPSVDYRLPENRLYLVKAWVESLAYTTEHNQQLRLMDHWIDNTHNGDIEMKLWLSFLWGCCYNSTGPWTIINVFPTPPVTPSKFSEFCDWYNENFDRMRFDTDCRYRKANMIACVKSYIDWLGGRSQEESYQSIFQIEDEKTKFETMWETVNGWKYYGRLSAWNCIEAIELVTGWKHGIDCQSFMLEDRSGSESNRNGACFLFNREDLLTKHGVLKTTGEPIKIEDCLELEKLIDVVFKECVQEFGHITKINRLNFETSGLCWFKKMFRERNTRYLGWDSERTFEEIEYMKSQWPEINVEPLFVARKYFIPEILLCEYAPPGVKRGVNKDKMAVFFNTGRPEHIIQFQKGERWVLGQPSVPVSKTTKRLW